MGDREYNVKRGHEGDKFYHEGDVRTLDEASAKHLVDLGVLTPRSAKTEAAPQIKAEPAPDNKSEPAPDNKADQRRKHGKGE